MLLSTGSKEIQQLRWNSSLGRVFGADSLKPCSATGRSMRSSHRAALPESVDADGGHAGGRALVEADREVERLGHRPERLVHRVADHLLAVIRVGAEEPTAHHGKKRSEEHTAEL